MEGTRAMNHAPLKSGHITDTRIAQSSLLTTFPESNQHRKFHAFVCGNSSWEWEAGNDTRVT